MKQSENGTTDISFKKGESLNHLRQRRRLATLLGRHKDVLASRMYETHFNPDWVARWNIHVPEHPKSYFIKKFLLPLLHLLILSLKTDNEALLYVYLDERLRFAPHREEWSRRVEFHRHLVSSDLQLVADLSADSFPDMQELQGLWLDIHGALLNQVNTNRQVTMLGVGDCLLNEVRVFLPARARHHGLALDMRCAYFSASLTGGLNAAEILDLIKSSKVDLISFSFFSYEGLPKYVHLMEHCDQLEQEEIDQSIANLIHIVRAYLRDLRFNTQIPFLVHTVGGLPLRRWRKYIPLLAPLSPRQRYVRQELNRSLVELTAVVENCLIIDEQAIVERSGGLRKCSEQVASQRRFGGLFHTSRFGNALSKAYLDYAAAFARLRKAKVLCVDFDNTLWRGVMADEEVEHWPERQRLLIQLREAGMLLVALSKNSEENIRWSEMELKPEDFVIRKINWNMKAQSLKEVARNLNLGTESFVVVDDSAQERALIADEIPEIVCLDSAEDATWAQLKWLLQFPNTQQTEEARNRTKLYQEQAERQNIMIATVDYPEMMASLNLWFRFEPAKTTQMNRVFELISRTNQFNTTTIRYRKEQLIEMTKDDGVKLFAAELGDRFGSMGLTAVLILRQRWEGTALVVFIDSFVMSCRAMGFSLEDQLLNEVKKFAFALGAERVVGRYVQTDRNGPCSNVFLRNGFAAVGETEFVWTVESGGNIDDIPWLVKRQ